ncbi:MAG TPA: hypothetical protein VGJ84_19120 [Polyangiaceae bacterium]
MADEKNKYLGSEHWSIGVDMEEHVLDIIGAMRKAMNGDSNGFEAARSELANLRLLCDRLERLLP